MSLSFLAELPGLEDLIGIAFDILAVERIHRQDHDLIARLLFLVEQKLADTILLLRRKHLGIIVYPAFQARNRRGGSGLGCQQQAQRNERDAIDSCRRSN